MENLDFEGKTHNEILDMLAEATAWLRDQLSAARPIVFSHPQMIGKMDQMILYFMQADIAHLPTLISCITAQKVVEPAEFPVTTEPLFNLEHLNETTD